MKPRRKRILPPPGPGVYTYGGITEAISEEEKAGRPVAPPIELRPAGPPLVVSEAISEEEKAGRPVAPLLPPPQVRQATPAPEEVDPPAEVVAMHAAFAELSEPERLVFEKVFLQGFSYTELASMLRSTPAVVRELTRSAARRLQAIVTHTSTSPGNGTPPPQQNAGGAA